MPKKELVAIDSGLCDSDQTWTQSLTDLKYSGIVNWLKWLLETAYLGTAKQFAMGRQSAAKNKLHEIWHAEYKDEAERLFNDFIKSLGSANIVLFSCRALAYIRTNNTIDSTFATVLLRTAKVRGFYFNTGHRDGV